MDLQVQFEAAFANTKTLTEKPDNETLLSLYSLYKQGTIGDATEANKPENAFDFVAMFKYNAWEKLAGMSKDDAMQAYINIVDKLVLG
ncbi:MAG: acyl-CoA-binding protein [Bacteroidota bacterium]|jgi:diazepam-binding inhibitor (GABA receptor modulating acyl-CoA-binding protein)